LSETARRFYIREVERIRRDAAFTAYKIKSRGGQATLDERHQLQDAAEQLSSMQQRLRDLELNAAILAAAEDETPPRPDLPVGA
jgi:hypothetical protein